MSDYQEQLGDLLTQMEEDYGTIRNAANGNDEDEPARAIMKQYPDLVDGSDGDIEDVVSQRWVGKIAALLRDKFQIVVPARAELQRTTSVENSPGRQETPCDQWVLGLGMFIRPRDWPAMDDSFYNQAQIHTWVWAG